MKKLRIAVCFLALIMLGCAQYVERVPPSVQGPLEAKYGAPLEFTAPVEKELEAWNGEDIVGMYYDDAGGLHVVSASAGEQVFGKAVQDAGEKVAAVGGNPSLLPYVGVSVGLVSLAALGGIFAGRKRRKAATDAELVEKAPVSATVPTLPGGPANA